MADKKLELLAPAGNMDCLAAAVLNGADAVYFGGGAFNARRGAKNFTGGELKYAIDYCRLRGVDAHITLNTLLFEGELAPALAFAREVYELGAAAVIVQDLGLAALIRERLPLLAVHASTQMGVHSPGGLKYCESLGVKRAVLAREVPLAEIKSMHEASPLELEFFCHGALCMGFSGSCLYSSMAGERSGNRGTCAQPCRKNASVLSAARAGADEFCLSTNDICMINSLEDLCSAGVCSLKIEGRMKQPEYVATVTRVYREAADALEKGAGFDINRAERELYEIFNRGDFSTSHLYFDSVKTGRTGHARPSKELVARAHESVRAERAVREASAALKLAEDSPAELILSLRDRPEIRAAAVGPVCEKPVKPIDPARYADQAKKLGGTVFFANDCAVSGAGFIPLSAVNAMRRQAADALAEEYLARTAPEPAAFSPDIPEPLPRKADGAPVRYVRVRTAAEAAAAAEAGAELVGLDPVCAAEADLSPLRGAGAAFVLILPNVLMTENARAAYKNLLESGAFRGVEINNIGQTALFSERASSLEYRIAGVGLNVMNSLSAEALMKLGATHFMPSPELTGAAVRAMAKRLGGAMIFNSYGRTPLMQLMHCPVKEYKGCRGCGGYAGALTDGEGRRFPLYNTRFGRGKGAYCIVRLMNTAVTDVREQAAGLPVFAFAETPDPESGPQITRGHWSRAVE